MNISPQIIRSSAVRISTTPESSFHDPTVHSTGNRIESNTIELSVGFKIQQIDTIRHLFVNQATCSRKGLKSV